MTDPAHHLPHNAPVDLEEHSFTDVAPWVVDPSECTWRRGIDNVRARTRRTVPQLTQRRRLPPIKRMVEVSWRLGRALLGWYLLDRRRGQDASRAGLSRRLRLVFQALGPTYVKLGQILSSGEGIFPPELVAEFRLLRDRVPAESFASVRRTVEAELGATIEERFERFDAVPIAAASIAQVHGARLRTGEEVVVKVQRARVTELVRDDLEVMSYLSPALVGRIKVAALANPPALVELFAETIVEELDFRLEADSMLDIAHLLAVTGQRQLLTPRPHPELVTEKVLVMERLDGFAFDDVASMHRAGVDTEAVLRATAVSFLEGVMLFGVFHGDLHGGNLLVRADGTVVLLDFGITGRLEEPQRLAFLRLLVGGTTNDVVTQVEALRDLGALEQDCDVAKVVVDLGLDRPPQDVVSLSAEELTKEMRELTKKLLGYGARMPKELMLFVKDLLFLDGAVATLAPEIDLLGEIATIATYFAERHGAQIAADVGVDPRTTAIDLDRVRASLGVAPKTEHLSYHELRDRRQEVRRKFRHGS